MKVIFEIPGKPGSKGRPRLGRYAVYTPDKTKNYEALLKYIFINEFKDLKPFEGAVRAKITAIFEVPKSYSKKKTALLLSNRFNCTSKPDTDNIAKIVLDSLNGLAFKDDAQITKLEVEKSYGEQAKVIVELEEI
jgi:Holliday junction resolvase RusA-like endonuclease